MPGDKNGLLISILQKRKEQEGGSPIQEQEQKQEKGELDFGIKNKSAFEEPEQKGNTPRLNLGDRQLTDPLDIKRFVNSEEFDEMFGLKS